MRFTAERAVKLLFKLFLEILDEQKVENEENQKNLEKTFLELENFLKKEHGISVNLISYLKYSNNLDDNKIKQLRKRILDYGNSLLREIENQR
jgi:ABC-type phosphate/phosphonate transport system substrate-binding protein